MAYTAINDGEDIDWSPPLEPSHSPYQLVWMKQPRQLPVPLLVWTANPIQLATKETMYEKSEAGVATVQTFFAYKDPKQGDPLTKRLVGANLSDITKPGLSFNRKNKDTLIGDALFPIQEIYPPTLDPDKTQTENDAANAIMATLRSLGAALCPRDVYIPPNGPIRSWFTPEFRKMAFDKYQFEENLDVVQEAMFHEFQQNPEAGVNRHVVGAALFDKNDGEPDVAKFGLPGTTTRITDRTKLKLKFDVRRTQYREERYNMVYTSPSDLFLRKFLYAPSYEYEDYAAFNNFINSMYSEYGSPAFQNWLTMRDINERILMMFGTGIRKMDPLRCIESEIMVDLFDWALLKGLELARTTPMSDTMTVHIDSWELRPHEKINKAMAYPADYVNYGGRTVPHLPQPTNWIGPDQFMLPCAVRDSKFKRGWPDFVNVLEHIVPEEMISKTPIAVSGGTTHLPPDDNKIVHYAFQFNSDAAHGTKVIGEKKRRIHYIRVPSNPLYQIELDPIHKKFLWLMGLLCSGTQTMKMGFKVEPFFKMVYPSNVTRLGTKDVYIDAYGELRIRGEKDAVPAPGAVDTSMPREARPAAPRPKPEDLDRPPAYTALQEAGEIPPAGGDDVRGKREKTPTAEELEKQYDDEEK